MCLTHLYLEPKKSLNMECLIKKANPPQANQNRDRSQAIPQGLQLVGDYSDSSDDSS